MKRTLSLLLAASSLTFAVGAQTQLVRGDVDGIQGTNRFRLDCTANVELISNTVNLQALHDASRQMDIEYEMQVIDVSAGGRTILNVVSAVQIPEIFGMGNLRFGRSETWEVFGTPGSPTAIYVDLTANTGYLPLGNFGTWILGPNAQFFRSGVIGATGQFRFNFQFPTIPSLLGTSFSAQAGIVQNGAVLITNPDCKEVRN